jgi:putative oxygen-independent coproporphyrinogen III oxidase
VTAPAAANEPPLGVYVHFPWCLQKCPYCDFYSLATERAAIPHRAYADAILCELERRAPELDEPPPLGSIFFGGGTPSLWEPRELGRVLRRILELFPSRGSVEVTAECNPSSFDERRAAELLEAGINRVSLGAQSLDAERLAFLGRLHDGAGALGAVRTALRAGFSRVSADLIFGVSGQSPEAARDEARAVAELGPTHVSAYALTIEPGTRFGQLAKAKSLPLLSDDLVARSFELVAETLEGMGFAHYEISNFAREGHYAEHNLAIWRGGTYVGIGAGAWGTVRTAGSLLRYRNAPAVDRYQAATAGAPLWSVSPLVSDTEHIQPSTSVIERLLLGLRLAEGVDLDVLSRATGTAVRTPERERAIEALVQKQRLIRDGTRVRIPKHAWLFSDAVIRELA